MNAKRILIIILISLTDNDPFHLSRRCPNLVRWRAGCPEKFATTSHHKTIHTKAYIPPEQDVSAFFYQC